MGRSVSYPTGSVVAFRLLDDGEYEDIDWVYECLVDEIIDTTKAAFPSFQRFDGWRGREDRILLRNAFADCGISTWCGLVAIWLVERDDPRYWEADFSQPRTARAQHWLARCPDGSSTCLVSCAWSGGSRMAKQSSSAPDPLAQFGPDPASSRSAGGGPWAGRGAPQPAARRPVLPAPA